MTDWNLPPLEIEQRSFAIIDAEAPPHDHSPAVWSIVRRMIHTTADFEYASSVRIHPRALEAGIEALRRGRPLFTDTRMALAGLSRRLAHFGVPADCLVSDPATAELAGSLGVTRSAAAVDLALDRIEDGIYVVGNAPTALFRLLEHLAAGRPGPALIVGLPVGFVNAAESKAALVESGAVFITNVGRKGGSNVAAGVVNALAELALAK
ncbi:MAG: precorrin-8X methylmutase [Pseudomonadota bacterium]